MNDVQRIISELERQRSAIEKAIAALREIGGSAGTKQSSQATKKAVTKKRTMSPEARARIAEATRKRWAAKRAAEKKAAKKAA